MKLDFRTDAPIGFIPSESAGVLNIIDSANFDGHRKVPITLPKGSRPMRVRVSPDNTKVYVSDGRAGTVTVLDAHSYAVDTTIKVGKRPWGIVLSPDGKFLFSPMVRPMMCPWWTSRRARRLRASRRATAPGASRSFQRTEAAGYCCPMMNTDSAVMLRVMPSL